MASNNRTSETYARYETADYLRSGKDRAAYLEVCMEEAGDDPAFILDALGTLARAYGMEKLAEKTGFTIEDLRETLSKGSDPSFGAVLEVVHAMGMRLSCTVRSTAAPLLT